MDRTCPACGKVFSFFCSEEAWGYAYESRLTCSYHCMRDMERRDKSSRPTENTVGRFVYRSLCFGKTYEQIAKTATARIHNLGDVDRLRAYTAKWMTNNPADVRSIEKEVERQRTMFNRKQVADMVGRSPDTVRSIAENIQIYGEKHSGKVYYTPQEVETIRRVIRGETA